MVMGSLTPEAQSVRADMDLCRHLVPETADVSLKVQVVNILGGGNHLVSATVPQVCHHSVKAATGHTSTHLFMDTKVGVSCNSHVS